MFELHSTTAPTLGPWRPPPSTVEGSSPRRRPIVQPCVRSSDDHVAEATLVARGAQRDRAALVVSHVEARRCAARLGARRGQRGEVDAGEQPVRVERVRERDLCGGGARIYDSRASRRTRRWPGLTGQVAADLGSSKAGVEAPTSFVACLCHVSLRYRERGRL